MNYQQIYNKLMQNAVGRVKLNRTQEGYVYYEKHHILPKCLGGTDNKCNLAYLTAEEHWVAHLLLVKLHPGNNKLVFACKAMSMIGGNNARVTNKMFGWIRREYSLATSERQKGQIIPEDTRRKISNTLKGRPAPHQQGNSNVSKRPDVAAKISRANTGRKLGPRSEETKAKISNANKGHKGVYGDANPSTWKVCCVVCKKETTVPVLGRNHKTC